MRLLADVRSLKTHDSNVAKSGKKTQQANKKYMFMRLLADVRSLKTYDSNVAKSGM